MDDLSTLLTAIAGLITAAGSVFALVWTTVRTSRRERPAAARGAVEQVVAEQLAAAAADGELTPEEISDVLKIYREGDEQR